MTARLSTRPAMPFSAVVTRLLYLFESQAGIARALGVDRRRVWVWLKSGIPVEHVLALEAAVYRRAVDLAIPVDDLPDRYDLDPETYGRRPATGRFWHQRHPMPVNDDLPDEAA